MFVRTERLFLRPAWPEDFDELVEVLSDADAKGPAGPAQGPCAADELRNRLDDGRDPRLPHFFMYLRAPGGPELVGSIGLAKRENEVEVGYWIVARHRGHGFAGEALRAVVNQARYLGHARVLANDFHDSPGTHEVLESAGFHDTGQERSLYSPARSMECAARIYVADLRRRTSHRSPMTAGTA